MSSCIPTCYEILLRAAGARGIDLDSFQDDFDLDQGLAPGALPENNFESVGDAVSARHTQIIVVSESFAAHDGDAKLHRIEDLALGGRVVLVSQALHEVRGRPGWHIMPVIDINPHSLMLFWDMAGAGSPRTETISKAHFVRIHRECPGGKEIAYLKSWS